MHTVDSKSIRFDDLKDRRESEDGFLLVGLIVAIFLILLVLGVAAPKMAEGLKRDREVEAVHRGNQYVRAIRLFYRKFGSYPGSIDQLEKSNNIRFLRQRYIDPMTGKDDWRIIHVGEAKTTVKGFFGQPLAGLTPGLGSAASLASGGGIGAGAAGSAGQSGGSAFGGSAFGSSSPGNGTSGSGLGGSTLPTLGGPSSSGPATLGGGTSSGPATLGGSPSGSPSTPGQSSGLGSAAGIQSSGAPSGGSPFVGVGIPKDGDSIKVLNEQTTYDTWEFLYDPRIEQLYAKGALMGSGGAAGLGSAAGNASGFGNTPSGFGNSPSGFGNSTSGFGNSPSGFGNTPGTPATGAPAPATPPSTPPQE